VQAKADEYASRHQRALESIAAGNVSASGGSKDGSLPNSGNTSAKNRCPSLGHEQLAVQLGHPSGEQEL